MVKLHYIGALCISYNLFASQGNGRSSSGTTGGKKPDGELPAELDFFKYAQGSIPKRKARQADTTEDEEMVDSDGEEAARKKAKADNEDKEEGPSQPRHRVTAKGANVPEPIESFEALQEKYNIPSRIVQNLKEYGYSTPTAIQSHAASILLEASISNAQSLV